MKRLLIGAITMMMCNIALAENPVYNYFQPADCDSDGWIWFDSTEKLNKYVGFQTKKKTFKVQLEPATWQYDNDGNSYEPTTSATVKGYNSKGEEGGEGSHTGGIILPIGNDIMGNSTPSDLGGAIMMHLPDCAEVSINVSSKSQGIYMWVFGSNGNVRSTDCYTLGGFNKFLSFDERMPNAPYGGNWLNIENYVAKKFDSTGAVVATISLKGEPGEAKTAYICNLSEEHDLIVHGMKVLTYTQTNQGSGINDIEKGIESAPIYNIYGQKVDDSYRGIVIKNGRKYVNNGK